MNMQQNTKIGINLRALLCSEISLALRNLNLENYEKRNEFITKLEERIKDTDFISLSNGTTFIKTFEP
jgi:hypothetical protein